MKEERKEVRKNKQKQNPATTANKRQQIRKTSETDQIDKNRHEDTDKRQR